MKYTFDTCTGKQVNTILSFRFEADDILAVFECEVNAIANWDIELIILRHRSTGITINTNTGSEIALDDVIGKQLMELASDGLKLKLYQQLYPAEKIQIQNFAIDGFKKSFVQAWQHADQHVYTQNYKGHDYKVSFVKKTGVNGNSMEWRISHIERCSL